MAKVVAVKRAREYQECNATMQGKRCQAMQNLGCMLGATIPKWLLMVCMWEDGICGLDARLCHDDHHPCPHQKGRGALSLDLSCPTSFPSELSLLGYNTIHSCCCHAELFQARFSSHVSST